MENSMSWNDIQRTISSGLLGDRSTWPEKVYNLLNAKNYVLLRDADPTDSNDTKVTEDVVKEAIREAIDEFYNLPTGIVGSSLVMKVYSALWDKSMINTSLIGE